MAPKAASERQDETLDESILTDLDLDNQNKDETTGSDSFPLSTLSGSAQSSIADSELDRIVKDTEEFLEQTTYISPPSPKSAFVTPSIPISQPTMSASPPPSVPTTRTHMPLPGSPQAPKTFAGNEKEIMDFVEHFELCANESQLPESERVSWLLQYLTKEWKDIFKTFDGCDEKDWTTFITTIKAEFAEAFKLKVSNRSSLLTFVKIAAKSPIQTASEFRDYNRKFQAIAKDLIKKNALTTEDKDTYFWFGLHETTRTLIKSELRIIHPSNPTDKPYPSANILSVGLQSHNRCPKERQQQEWCTFQQPFANEYKSLGKASEVTDTVGRQWWRLGNGEHIPRHPQGLKAGIDQYYNSQQKTDSLTSQSQSFMITVNPTPPTVAIASFIEEIIDSPTMETLAAKAFTKPQSSTSSVPAKLAQTIPFLQTDKKQPQFQYQSKLEDPAIAQSVFEKILNNPIMLPTRELIAVSPDLQKLFVDGCKVNKITIPVFTPEPKTTMTASANAVTTQAIAPHMAPIREVDVYVQGRHREVGIFDPGAELVCISAQAAKDLGLPFSMTQQLSMKDANGGSKETYSIIKNLELKISGISLFVQAWIIENPPYWILLGQPFQIAGRIDTEDVGEVLIMRDPENDHNVIKIPTRVHKKSVKV
ncbi:hypothetical protein Clacol_004481 [Clathrus columnatus]|uniref:DUF4100 domain-containing protein n=1 Tax=Clathrus columnatus TaxID=1419009 RepID=A0AAV5AE91_9AGAM|nr:hypothetical protein Clacol_004481 [Clathrus columnatus]